MADDVEAHGQTVAAGRRRPLHYETLVLNDGEVHGLQEIAAAEAAGYPINWVLIRVRCPANSSGGVAWRADGSVPTATDGMPAEHLTEEDYPGDPANFQFIQLTADPVTLHVHYFY